jgi:hypothetical protein
MVKILLLVQLRYHETSLVRNCYFYKTYSLHFYLLHVLGLVKIKLCKI